MAREILTNEREDCQITVSDPEIQDGMRDEICTDYDDYDDM